MLKEDPAAVKVALDLVTDYTEKIIKDVPKQLEAHGDKAAFHDSILSATPAVVKALYDAGRGIYVETSQGTPFLDYPEARNISVPAEHVGDYDWLIEEISKKLSETGADSLNQLPLDLMVI